MRENAQAGSVGAGEPVSCFVAFEGHHPRFLETRPYTVVDAVMDAHAEAEAAGLSREDVIEHMAGALRGAGRKPSSSKTGKQPVGCGGAGSRQAGGRGLRGGAEGARVIEAKAQRGRLPRRTASSRMTALDRFAQRFLRDSALAWRSRPTCQRSELDRGQTAGTVGRI
jgi:hypothetical protein